MEAEFLQWLHKVVATSSRVRVGIGDDAAVVEGSDAYDTVVTTDLIADGTHFVSADLTGIQIGHKSLAVNLSDLAAMGATAQSATVALLLPRTPADPLANATKQRDVITAAQLTTAQLARDILQGIYALAKQFDVDLIGGDTNVWPGRLAVSVTAFGTVPTGQAWRRSTAREGDRILVTGELGGSLLGHHHQFQPRLDTAGYVRQHYEIHAAMDVSDGLALDLTRMASASELGAVVYADRIPISAAAERMAAQDGRLPLSHALQDGEDFELLLAVAPEVASQMLADRHLGVNLSDIGSFQRAPQMWLVRDQQREPLAPDGYLHQ